MIYLNAALVMRCYYSQEATVSQQYWWNNEIGSLRAACFLARMFYQNLRRNLVAIIERKYIGHCEAA